MWGYAYRIHTYEQTKTKLNSKRITLLESMIMVNLITHAEIIKAIINTNCQLI